MELVWRRAGPIKQRIYIFPILHLPHYVIASSFWCNVHLAALRSPFSFVFQATPLLPLTVIVHKNSGKQTSWRFSFCSKATRQIKSFKNSFSRVESRWNLRWILSGSCVKDRCNACHRSVTFERDALALFECCSRSGGVIWRECVKCFT